MRRRADIVFSRARVAVYVDGCFWHSCPQHASVPKNNRDWWIDKLEANVRRDRDTDRPAPGCGLGRRAGLGARGHARGGRPTGATCFGPRHRTVTAMTELRWSDLAPDRAMVAALDRADAGGTRAAALLATGSVKNNWSNRFADACAVMIADELRRHRTFRSLIVRPPEGGAAEPLTFAAGGRSKKVDVVVSSVVSGLQVGFSLKGMNFRDSAGMQFDKNLTGRTYELQDEVSVIHRYQPAAFLVAVYFMPLAATADKRSALRSRRSLGRSTHLRGRTGRLDPTLPGQMDRVDAAAVALYVPGDVESIGVPTYVDELAVVVWFDTSTSTPIRLGEAVHESTRRWILPGLVDGIASRERCRRTMPSPGLSPRRDEGSTYSAPGDCVAMTARRPRSFDRARTRRSRFITTPRSGAGGGRSAP